MPRTPWETDIVSKIRHFKSVLVAEVYGEGIGNWAAFHDFHACAVGTRKRGRRPHSVSSRSESSARVVRREEAARPLI